MKNKKQPKLKKLKEEDEVIRLGLEGGETEEKVEKLVVGLDEFEGEEGVTDRRGVEEIDSLLTEEKLMPDSEIDFLFQEEKKVKHDSLETTVTRALVETKTSKASMLRGKSGHATHQTLEEAQMGREEREEKDWGVEKEVGRNSLKYVFLGLFVVLLGGGAWGALKLRESSKTSVYYQDQKAALADLIKKRAETKRILAEVEKVFTAFNKAKSTDKLAFILDSDALKEDVLKYYKNPKNKENYKVEKIDYIAEQFISGRTVWMLAFYYREGGLIYKRIFLDKDANGEFKVDWRALSGYNKTDWSKFVAKQDKEAKVFRMRVKVAGSPYYNWGFNDKTHWVYSLSLEGEEKSYWGYLDKKNKEVHSKMKKIIKKAKQSKKLLRVSFDEVMLKVRYPKDTPVENTDCMIIDEVISAAWVDPREKK